MPTSGQERMVARDVVGKFSSKMGRRIRMASSNWKCTLIILALLLAVTAGFEFSARASEVDAGSIHITDPWARATPKGASAGAGYMTITNRGGVSDRVTCISSDISAQCQIHTMSMDNGTMKMRPVEGGLEIKRGESIVLKPAGLHIMLSGLRRPLEQGKTATVTLQFEQAGTVKVELPIAAIAADAPPGKTDSQPMHDHGDSMMQMEKH